MPRLLLIAGTVLLFALPMAAQQQDSSASGSSSSQQNQSSSDNAQKKDQSGSAGSASTPAKKDNGQKPASTAAQNPFPEAESEKAAEQDQEQQQQESAPSASAPRTAPPPKSSSTADQNPFPEAQSEKAAEKDQREQQQKAGDDYSSSSSDVKNLNLPAEARPLVAGAPGNTGLNPDLANKDVKVGNFYLQTGDYKGAYDRFLEATQVNPGSAEAVYGLADAARRLNKRDVAIQYYQLYLSALPNGPRAKDARKALKELGAEANR